MPTYNRITRKLAESACRFDENLQQELQNMTKKARKRGLGNGDKATVPSKGASSDSNKPRRSQKKELTNGTQVNLAELNGTDLGKFKKVLDRILLMPDDTPLNVGTKAIGRADIIVESVIAQLDSDQSGKLSPVNLFHSMNVVLSLSNFDETASNVVWERLYAHLEPRSEQGVASLLEQKFLNVLLRNTIARIGLALGKKFTSLPLVDQIAELKRRKVYTQPGGGLFYRAHEKLILGLEKEMAPENAMGKVTSMAAPKFKRKEVMALLTAFIPQFREADNTVKAEFVVRLTPHTGGKNIAQEFSHLRMSEYEGLVEYWKQRFMKSGRGRKKSCT